MELLGKSMYGRFGAKILQLRALEYGLYKTTRVCQGNVPASSYCFHCKVKLCSDCIIHHRKLPALMEHTVEDLGKLSEQRLAECWQVMCSSHPGRPAELFCSAHGDVICALCSSTAHRGCERLEVISDAAKQKRDELREQVGVLELRNERLTKEVCLAKACFVSFSN